MQYKFLSLLLNKNNFVLEKCIWKDLDLIFNIQGKYY